MHFFPLPRRCCWYHCRVVVAVTVIQIEVMRARNKSTLLIIIKCCSMSFILTANVYTVMLANNKWQPVWQSDPFYARYRVIFSFFFSLLFTFSVLFIQSQGCESQLIETINFIGPYYAFRWSLERFIDKLSFLASTTNSSSISYTHSLQEREIDETNYTNYTNYISKTIL